VPEERLSKNAAAADDEREPVLECVSSSAVTPRSATCVDSSDIGVEFVERRERPTAKRAPPVLAPLPLQTERVISSSAAGTAQ